MFLTVFILGLILAIYILSSTWNQKHIGGQELYHYWSIFDSILILIDFPIQYFVEKVRLKHNNEMYNYAIGRVQRKIQKKINIISQCQIDQIPTKHFESQEAPIKKTNSM